MHELTVRTPGAHGAVCNVYVEKMRYKFRAPETRNIFKSKEDLIVDCMAPGNRRKKVIIKPTIADSLPWNAPIAPIGVTWDYASGAMFDYPDVVEVDFTDAPARPADPPFQNMPDIIQPEDYDLEEFNPGTPRLNSDRNRSVITPRKRQPGGAFGFDDTDGLSDTGLYEGAASGGMSGGTIPPTSNDLQGYGGKGELDNVIQRTGARMSNGLQDNSAAAAGTASSAAQGTEAAPADDASKPTVVLGTTYSSPEIPQPSASTTAPADGGASDGGETAEPMSLQPSDFAPDIPTPNAPSALE